MAPYRQGAPAYPAAHLPRVRQLRVLRYVASALRRPPPLEGPPHAAGTVMTVKEVAERLGLSPATIRVQLLRGKLRGVKRGRDWWITPKEVERYRRDSKRQP